MSHIRTAFVAKLVLLNLAASAVQAAPACKLVFESNSEKYINLELESSERLTMIRERNRDVFDSLKDSDLNKIADKIFKGNLSDHPNGREMKSEKLRNGDQLILRDNGIGKSTDLIIKKGDSEKVLANNFEEARNNRIRISNFSVSPDQNYVVVYFYEKGSIDNFFFDVYSLKDGKRTVHRLEARGNTTAKIAWLQDDVIAYQAKAFRHSVEAINVATNRSLPSMDMQYIWAQFKNYSVLSSGQNYYIVDGRGGKEVLALKNSFQEIVGEADGILLFRTENDKGTGFIESYDLVTKAVTPIFSKEGQVITASGIIGEHIWIGHMRGADRHFEILDSSGKSIADMTIPVGTNIIDRKWEKEGEVLTLGFTSKVHKKIFYTWNLKTKPDLRAIEKELNSDKGVKYISHIVEVKSADGTLIPMRLTHRRDIKINGQNPSYISVYGGFNSAGHMHNNQFNRIEKAFIEQGGILVGPAVRGGNEFGTEWYYQAKGPDKKTVTLDDTIAAAQWLTDNGYSNPEKIIAQGASNGGFVVAAAALKAPGVFGLVIPKVGVHDMLGKERLDVRASFKQDYGDANEAATAELMKNFSPLELKQTGKNPTEFFILVGANDSRVNPIHSYKLIAALKDQGLKADMLTLKNAGHFSESIENVNTVGWRAQAYVWAKIFQFVGFKFK